MFVTKSAPPAPHRPPHHPSDLFQRFHPPQTTPIRSNLGVNVEPTLGCRAWEARFPSPHHLHLCPAGPPPLPPRHPLPTAQCAACAVDPAPRSRRYLLCVSTPGSRRPALTPRPPRCCHLHHHAAPASPPPAHARQTEVRRVCAMTNASHRRRRHLLQQ